MSAPKEKFFSQHQTPVVVVGCMDFRFQEYISEAVQEAFEFSSFDKILLAGGAKNVTPEVEDYRMKTTLEDIKLAVEKHGVKSIVLLNHENCGKYASEGHTFANSEEEELFHKKELEKARKLLEKLFSENYCQVLTGFLYVDEKGRVRIKNGSAAND